MVEKIFKQLLFLCLATNRRERKVLLILFRYPIKTLDPLDFSSEDRISGTNSSFIHEENIKRVDSGVTQLLVIIGAKRSGSRFARFCFARRRKYT